MPIPKKVTKAQYIFLLGIEKKRELFNGGFLGFSFSDHASTIEELERLGLIHSSGDELFVTQKGKLAMRKYVDGASRSALDAFVLPYTQAQVAKLDELDVYLPQSPPSRVD